MPKLRLRGPYAVAALGALVLGLWQIPPDTLGSRAVTAAAPPAFEVDPFWPKPLPNNWILGQVAGIAVDSQDHIWLIQRPGSLTEDERGAAPTPAPEEGSGAGALPRSDCCVPAPPVMEFDAEGNLIQAWGGPGEGYDWPENEHGIFVDHNDNVWIAGNGDNDHQVLKFSRDGTFLLQIGTAGQTGGSNDTQLLGRPADTEVDPETNEVYVADGYLNKRVIVFDAETGEYKRHWGAYGNEPVDDAPAPTATAEAQQPGQAQQQQAAAGAQQQGAAAQQQPQQQGAAGGQQGQQQTAQAQPGAEPGQQQQGQAAQQAMQAAATTPAPYNPADPPAQQFRNPVHCVRITDDGLVYVCDRVNNRYQVFQKDGTFVEEVFLARDTLGNGAVWDLDTSPDEGQSFLYNADGENNHVWILARDTGEVLGTFGRHGRYAGQFHWVHNLVTDSQGNIYTAEVDTGKRAQKFRAVNQ